MKNRLINLRCACCTVIAFIFFLQAGAQKQYNYEMVKGDPMNTRIYTLDNGLKVYLSVYKDAPRIQTAIAVRTGSKNDPPDNTGLSHYLEHVMFKGTTKFGTIDWVKEEPFMTRIEELFETYRGQKDSLQRKATYRLIDSISGIAAQLAIANEYDKMLAVMGAKGTNAFTSNEQTVYINDIPSNQLETYLLVESERFRQPVFRIFHTELETVYEEKNMSLDSDDDKAWEALFAGLFQKHPYGTQTTIGTIEHLKNPSLKALKAYYNARYVPNNMALCLSGDFNPEEVIALVEKYWGDFRQKTLAPFVPPQELPVAEPVVKEVIGPDAESVMIGYRLGGRDTRDADLLTMMNMILYNGTAGLIDLNLVQAQKVLEGYSFNYTLKDYSTHIFAGKPKEGQSLEQVRDLMLGQVELVKKGDFADWLIPAIINDLKLQRIRRFESNMGRAMTMVEGFVMDEPWERTVNEIARLEKITRDDIIKFAKANYTNNYVVVFKRTGVAPDVQKITKPSITPVEVNREAQSDFVKMVSERKPPLIEPVFLDFKKDIRELKTSSGKSLFYNKNSENQAFELYVVFERGTSHDLLIGLALEHLKYLGTSEFKPAEFKQELYKAGCSLNVQVNEDQVWVSLSGLAENFDQGMKLFESLLDDPVPNEPAYKNQVQDILKQRADAKLNKNIILWEAMYNYGQFGPNSPFTHIVNETRLTSMDSKSLIGTVRNLKSLPHHFLYYGPTPEERLMMLVNKRHKINPSSAMMAETKFQEKDNEENQVYVVDYDMKQVEILMLSKSLKYDKEVIPQIRIFNEYFGGSMASIVFQELREARALAYSAYGGYRGPVRPDRHNYVFAYIGTQVDKLPEAMNGMMNLFNNMPESPKSFNEAKEAVINKIRTERITKAMALITFENSRRFGLDYDIRRDVFNKVPSLAFADLKKFEESRMKNKNFNIMVLGKKEKLDIPTLEKYGKVNFLTLEDVFGY